MPASSWLILSTLFLSSVQAGPFGYTKPLQNVSKRQTSSVTCEYATWVINEIGETPCTVWAELGDKCNPGFTVEPLPADNKTYASPSGNNANNCQCNIVAYNLMAGCSWCQPGVFSADFPKKDAWRSNCASFNADGLDSSVSTTGLHIPAWAFHVDDSDSWFAFEASTVAAGSAPETGTASATRATATGTARPTSNSTAGNPTFCSTCPVSGDPPDYDFPSTYPVVGTTMTIIAATLGAIGGLSLISLGIGLWVLFSRQRKRKEFYGAIARQHQQGQMMGSAPPMGSYAQPLLAPSYGPPPGMAPPPQGGYMMNTPTGSTATYTSTIPGQPPMAPQGAMYYNP